MIITQGYGVEGTGSQGVVLVEVEINDISLEIEIDNLEVSVSIDEINVAIEVSDE